jgi:hypothetical protein
MSISLTSKILRVCISVLILALSVVAVHTAVTYRGTYAVDACGKAGPSCRHCYVGVYTAQCPK